MKTKEYKVISNLVIELIDECEKELIEQEILDAIIEIVEKNNCYVGGGFHLEEYVEGEDDE